MTAADLRQRRRVLFTMLTALEYRSPPGHEPALIVALRAWLHGWPGIGRIVAGMSRRVAFATTSISQPTEGLLHGAHRPPILAPPRL